ncbi:alpha/beta fold hydrolase [Pedobacter nutrimenti]|uniref:Pimeloyl-ACP methyl ester carboxylesterase n=1 Tax=Pedobacter nutrimenti TaxID=1241337 RepID=A0A318UBC0_9SPHI|nr:alpha/beta fold hydrolase [Pedobacter nutrimenti]PYF72710.1 pimeloyl-ACP methyl ester carboxylesterase [Pedobacter nutrimenti]
MYKYLYVAVALALNVSVKAQVIVEGKVKNRQNEDIPYCSIGIKNSKVATLTNDKGMYRLTIPDDLKDKEVVFNSAGYQERTFSVRDLKANANVFLADKVMALEEVVIQAKGLKEKIIGQKSRPFLTFSKMFDENVPTVEQGNIFPIYEKTRLNAYSFYIIPSSKFAELTLKLNVYAVKNGLPDQSLLNKNVIYKTSATGWQKIDLSPYKLVFNHLKEIAVTIQLIDSKSLENTKFIFGMSAKKSLSKNLLFRYQPQGSWEASEGNFISNIDVGYRNAGKEENIAREQGDTTTSDVATEQLVDFYRNREKAKKTNYGKNKKGTFTDVGDAKIYYEIYGKGAPLLLLHGNNGSIADFYQQIPAFSKNYQVIALDTRGQGRSTDLTGREYSYEQFAADLYKVIQHLQLSKVNIVGWSDGGNTGLIFNAAHPELVAKLVTIGANLNPSGVDKAIMDGFKQQLSENKMTDPRLLKLMLSQPDIASGQLDRIKNPVLIIAGSKDVIREEHTRFIHQQIRNSELEIIPNSTHYVPFEQPERLNELILKFLGK